MSEAPPTPTPAEGRWERYGHPVMMALIVAAALYNIVTWSQAGRRQSPELRQGSSAPQVELPLLGGGRTTLAAKVGKVELLVFWATWCPACVDELPRLARVHKLLEGQPVEFTLVNQDAHNAERELMLQRFSADHRISLPVALDDGRAYRAYRIEKLPYMVIVDKAGRVRAAHTGVWHQQALVDSLRAAMVPGKEG